MRNLVLLPLAFVFSNYCFGINLDGNAAKKVYQTFYQPLTKVSQEWNLLILKSYLDPNTKIDEEKFSNASTLGKVKDCEETKLSGPYTPLLKGSVSFFTICNFENGKGKVEILAEFSENTEESKILLFEVTPI